MVITGRSALDGRLGLAIHTFAVAIVAPSIRASPMIARNRFLAKSIEEALVALRESSVHRPRFLSFGTGNADRLLPIGFSLRLMAPSKRQGG
jgi:hypothetical protein